MWGTGSAAGEAKVTEGVRLLEYEYELGWTIHPEPTRVRGGCGGVPCCAGEGRRSLDRCGVQSNSPTAHSMHTQHAG